VRGLSGVALSQLVSQRGQLGRHAQQQLCSAWHRGQLGACLLAGNAAPLRYEVKQLIHASGTVIAHSYES
jgi:hypothetical protein